MEEEINTVHLKKVLDYLTSELNTSFIEKRIASNKNDWDPVTELTEALHMMSEREKKLSVVVRISHFIIDKNESLQREYTYKVEEVAKCKDKLMFFKKENERLKRELNSKESVIKDSLKLVEENELKHKKVRYTEILCNSREDPSSQATLTLSLIHI